MDAYRTPGTTLPDLPPPIPQVGDRVRLLQQPYGIEITIIGGNRSGKWESTTPPTGTVISHKCHQDDVRLIDVELDNGGRLLFPPSRWEIIHKPSPLRVGDKVRLYDKGKPSTITGSVVRIQASDNLVGVDLDGGGYFQCGSRRWKKIRVPEKIQSWWKKIQSWWKRL